MKKIHIMLCFLFIVMFIALFNSCNKTSEMDPLKVGQYSSVNMNNNRIMNYCVIDDTQYVDYYYITSSGELRLIDENIPCAGSKIDIQIRGITTDGECLYMQMHEVTLVDDVLKRIGSLQKVDLTTKTMTTLAEWNVPRRSSNNPSVQFMGDWVYFFKENEFESNDVCRVKKDGSSYEQLTNNDGSVYTGIFFYGDEIFIHKDNSLYRAVDANIDELELFYEDLYTIELYNDMFLCTRLSDKAFISIPVSDSGHVNELFQGVYSDCYIIKDNIIYYAPIDPICIGTMPDGTPIINETQGKIYTYNMITSENSLFFQNSEINYIELLNINDTALIAQASTNDQYLTSQSGVETNYYYIPLNGDEQIEIKNYDT